MYELIMINAQGASETTYHQSLQAVRTQIRSWQYKTMTARVFDGDGKQLFDGPAPEFDVYVATCKQLGFDAAMKFVEIKRGKIGFTCGKPEEIRALRRAAIDAGFAITKGLKEAAL